MSEEKDEDEEKDASEEMNECEEKNADENVGEVDVDVDVEDLALNY